MPAIVYLVMSMAVPLCFPATSATPATAFPFVPRPNIEYYRLGVVRPNDAGAIHIATGILQSYGTLAAPRETLIVLRDPSTHKQSQFVIAPGAKLDGISLFAACVTIRASALQRVS